MAGSSPGRGLVPISKVVPERTADFLRMKRGSAYCDDCITKNLGVEKNQQAQQATKPLGLSKEFTRGDAICAACGSGKAVTRAY